MAILLLIVTGTIALALVFIVCEIGQRLNDAFEKTSFTIDQLDWYLFPSEVQCLLPMIIAIAQQPAPLECFGSMACNRDVFKNVGIFVVFIQSNCETVADLERPFQDPRVWERSF